MIVRNAWLRCCEPVVLNCGPRLESDHDYESDCTFGWPVYSGESVWENDNNYAWHFSASSVYGIDYDKTDLRVPPRTCHCSIELVLFPIDGGRRLEHLAIASNSGKISLDVCCWSYELWGIKLTTYGVNTSINQLLTSDWGSLSGMVLGARPTDP